MRWLVGITNSMDMNLGKLQYMVRDRKSCMLQSLGSQRVGHDLETKQQQGPRRQIHYQNEFYFYTLAIDTWKFNIKNKYQYNMK